VDRPTRADGGPGYVYLSGHPAPTDAAQLHQGGAIEVARLKGNVGSQNYELPANVDLSQFRSVVIYCKQFNVVFSTAALVAATS
jgi:Electron transfer DM13